MTSEEARIEIERLSDLIDHHNELYYQQSTSEISDHDFDQLLEKLIELENDFPDLKSSPVPPGIRLHE